MPTKSPVILINAAEAGKMLGLSAWSVGRLRRSKRLPERAIIRITERSIKYRKDILEKYQSGEIPFGMDLNGEPIK